MNKKIDKLFERVVQEGASDLHLSSGSPPCLRVDGSIMMMDESPLKSTEVHSLIFEILNERQKRDFIDNWELDCSYSLKGVGRFRCNVFMQRRGLGGVFRLIPNKLSSLDELGIPPSLNSLTDLPRGLVVVTGPTGSGKSTTLAAFIHTINQTKRRHIVTIEDPIEFVHTNIKSLINQREVHSHTKSFTNALRASLREDPDIILLGEMRDLETIHLAMTAAETGHLVFGTLHTNNASKTVDRIIDVFPDKQQAQIRTMLSESLQGVVAQTLFKKADQKGRVAVFEVLTNTNAVANLIREGKTFQLPSAIQTGIQHGMMSFESSLTELVLQRQIHQKDAEDFLGRPLDQSIKQMSRNSMHNRPSLAASQNPSGKRNLGLLRNKLG